MHLHLSDEENKAKGEEENNGVYAFKKCLLIFRWWYKGLEQDFTCCGSLPPCFQDLTEIPNTVKTSERRGTKGGPKI